MKTDPTPPTSFRLEEGLRQLARETRPTNALPDAAQLWWRAEVIRRLVARENAARQAERPLLWGRAAALVLALLGLVPLISRAPSYAMTIIVLGLTPLTLLFAWLVLRRET